ncbi:MAG TPA: sigma 54-interacting transcriptional regulator [Terriglobales bacterium]|nr:sigma 54-interacting transcriptional regulator [Terriglobales bacterium]
MANVAQVPDLDSLFTVLSSIPQDLLVLDLDSIGGNPRESENAAYSICERFPQLRVIGLTRSRQAAGRIRSIIQNVFIAPVDPDKLQSAVMACLNGDASEAADMVRVTSDRRSLAGLIGASEPMQMVYEAILRLADSGTTVLIRGESGSGKELAARAMVSLGRRSAKPFISLNCAALPESLIETELFGHERGAYTGADRARPGQIELAHTGTLFLDEIATLTLPLQSKLLRVLEDREVRRIGGNTGRAIDFRLITATNEDLEEMVKAGRFREDLYYRINVVPLDLPPLREREGDIPLLVDHYLKHFCALEGLQQKHIAPEAIEILEDYNWPGNVRELENLVQRLVLMVTGDTIEARHLPKSVLFASHARNESLLIPEEGLDFPNEMERIEAAYVRAALRRTSGVKNKAAKLLNISERQMKYLCHKHGL